MTTIRLKSLGVALSAVLITAAHAQVPEHRGPPAGGDGPDGPLRQEHEARSPHKDAYDTLLDRLVANREVAEHMGLTDGQITRLRDESHELRLRQIDLRAELEKAALKQARVMTEEAVDEEALMRAVEDSGSIRTEMAKVRMRQLLLLRNVLTKDQLRKMQKLRDRRAKTGRGEGNAPPRQGRPSRGEGHERAGAPPAAARPVEGAGAPE